MKIGEKISIISGPFEGNKAEILEQLNADLYKVSVEIFGKFMEIEISAKMLGPKSMTSKKANAGVVFKKRQWWIQRLGQVPSAEIHENFLAFTAILNQASEAEKETWRDDLMEEIFAQESILSEMHLERCCYLLWWWEHRYNLELKDDLKNEVEAAQKLESKGAKMDALHNIFLDNGWRSLNLLLQDQIKIDFELFPLDNAPEDFPWKFESIKPKTIIDHIFQPIEQEARELIDVFKGDILCILGIKINGQYFLLYVGEYYNGEWYDNAVSTNFILGGVPTKRRNLPDKLLEIGWKKLPQSLDTFYTVHSRLGPLPFIFDTEFMDDTTSIKSIDELSVMTFMNQVVIDLNEPTDYDFNNMLEFYSSGDGNGHHFYKEHLDDPTSDTVIWWDHETREMGRETSFWQVLNTQGIHIWFGYV